MPKRIASRSRDRSQNDHEVPFERRKICLGELSRAAKLLRDLFDSNQRILERETESRSTISASSHPVEAGLQRVQIFNDVR